MTTAPLRSVLTAAREEACMLSAEAVSLRAAQAVNPVNVRAAAEVAVKEAASGTYTGHLSQLSKLTGVSRDVSSRQSPSCIEQHNLGIYNVHRPERTERRSVYNTAERSLPGCTNRRAGARRKGDPDSEEQHRDARSARRSLNTLRCEIVLLIVYVTT